MRRKDREITEMQEIIDLLKQGELLNLAFFDEEYPYVIPLNYGVGADEDGLCLYIHGASEGKKIECLNRDNRVGFSVISFYQVQLKEPACKTTAAYGSVCGGGRISVIEEESEKLQALAAIMAQCSGEESFVFEPKAVEKTTVLKLSVEEIHGKANQR